MEGIETGIGNSKLKRKYYSTRQKPAGKAQKEHGKNTERAAENLPEQDFLKDNMNNMAEDLTRGTASEAVALAVDPQERNGRGIAIVPFL